MVAFLKSKEEFEGTFKSPILLLIELMIVKDKIQALAEGFLENTDKFIMDTKVKPGNLIIITIDGDSLVSIDDCISLSRAVEGSLDRDQEDFELRVMSYGADSPLMQLRQYPKHIGRELIIKKTDETQLDGKLLEVQQDEIVISCSKSNKKNADEITRIAIPFNEILEAKISLSFK